MHKFLYQRSTGNTCPLDQENNVERDDKFGQFIPEKYVLAQVVNPDIPDRNEFEKRGGTHLGIVRNWIKWNCLNGDDVTWGSFDLLKFKGITVKELEMLAVDIAYHILKEKDLVK